MPGVKSFGFHEGSRSEYLAQYVFASWGTAVVIPQQEDHGLDLHCTLMDREDQLLLAKSPYTVQIKSQMQPLVFKGQEVRWVIDHPLPLFVCVVDKKTAHLSVYQTMPRFHAWALGSYPDRLSMTPVPYVSGREGRCAEWVKDHEFSLDQPILDFDIKDLLSDECWLQARTVMEHWIKLENENLTRIRMRLPICRLPDPYKTNDVWLGGWKTLSFLYPTEEQIAAIGDIVSDTLSWLGDRLLRKGDIGGAAKAAILFRHLNQDRHTGVPCQTMIELNRRIGDKDYWFSGVDCLAKLVEEALDCNQSETKQA